MLDESQNQDERCCHNCQQKIRPGAKFCINCGCALDIFANPALSYDFKQSNSSFFESNWKEIKQVGWLFGLLLCCSFVLGMIAKFNSTPWPEVYVSCIDALIVFVFVGLNFSEMSHLLRLPKLNIRYVTEMVVLILCFITLWNVYFTLIERAGVPLGRVASIYQKAGWHIGPMLVLVSIMPAFVEELGFRGVIQSTLNHVFHEREAWLIQAALFSVLHLSPLMFPSHFLMGFCLGYMRLRTKSLYPGMALHAAWNAFVLCKEIC